MPFPNMKVKQDCFRVKLIWTNLIWRYHVVHSLYVGKQTWKYNAYQILKLHVYSTLPHCSRYVSNVFVLRVFPCDNKQSEWNEYIYIKKDLLSHPFRLFHRGIYALFYCRIDNLNLTVWSKSWNMEHHVSLEPVFSL